MRSAAADRVAALAHRLAGVIDLPTAEQLARVATEAGESEAVVWAERGAASVNLTLAELGNPDVRDDLDDRDNPDELDGRDDRDDRDDLDDGDDLDRVYLEAEAIAADVAARLGLPPADELAVDGLAGYPGVALLRAGHWSVSVAPVHYDPDLPVTVQVNLSYGADLPGRLAQLAGPGVAGGQVDWAAVAARIGADVPRDYRWLIEHYGAATFGGHFTLMSPEQLSPPVFGQPSGMLRYVDFVLPVATTVDGATVSWVVQPYDRPDSWHMQVVKPGAAPWDMNTGLLQFLVVTLSGAYPIPGTGLAR